MSVRTLLHVGCGPKEGTPVPREFGAYRETRLDVNRAVDPDIVASVVAMPMIEDESYDAVFASHVLEHLFRHECVMALAEILRVLKPSGFLLVRVPDLQSIGGKIALDEADQVVYSSPIGHVRPLDMIFGHAASVSAGNLHMAHKNGFTAGVLKRALVAAGFLPVETKREPKFELEARAYKPDRLILTSEETASTADGEAEWDDGDRVALTKGDLTYSKPE